MRVGTSTVPRSATPVRAGHAGPARHCARKRPLTLGHARRNAPLRLAIERFRAAANMPMA
jgi:hypothetical protein